MAAGSLHCCIHPHSVLGRPLPPSRGADCTHTLPGPQKPAPTTPLTALPHAPSRRRGGCRWQRSVPHRRRPPRGSSGRRRRRAGARRCGGACLRRCRSGAVRPVAGVLCAAAGARVQPAAAGGGRGGRGGRSRPRRGHAGGSAGGGARKGGAAGAAGCCGGHPDQGGEPGGRWGGWQEGWLQGRASRRRAVGRGHLVRGRRPWEALRAGRALWGSARGRRKAARARLGGAGQPGGRAAGRGAGAAGRVATGGLPRGRALKGHLAEGFIPTRAAQPPFCPPMPCTFQACFPPWPPSPQPPSCCRCTRSRSATWPPGSAPR